jgi:hypothetical protein
VRLALPGRQHARKLFCFTFAALKQMGTTELSVSLFQLQHIISHLAAADLLFELAMVYKALQNVFIGVWSKYT